MRLNFALTFTLIVLGLGCTHTSPKDGELPDPSKIEDDEFIKQSKTPDLCNPQGKTGEDLKKCLAKNDALSQDLEDAAKKREPWFNFSKNEWSEQDLIPEAQVLTIKSDKLSQAINSLEKAAFTELSNQDLSVYTTGTLPAGLKPFLVRGLGFKQTEGTTQVYLKQGEILVRHDAIGKVGTTEEKRPLVILLKTAPKEVFVDCQINE